MYGGRDLDRFEHDFLNVFPNAPIDDVREDFLDRERRLDDSPYVFKKDGLVGYFYFTIDIQNHLVYRGCDHFEE